MQKKELITKIKEVAKNKNITLYSLLLEKENKSVLEKILYCFELSDAEIEKAYRKFVEIMPNYAKSIKDSYKTSGYFRCALLNYVEAA